MINVISQYQCTYTPEYPATHAPDGTCIAGCPVGIHYDTQEYGFRSREISDIKILKRRNTKGYHRQILIVGYRGLNELVYSQRIKAEQEYLYRIAYFYQGEETAALETIQETVARGFREGKNQETAEEFHLEITRILLQQGGVNQKPNRYLTALYLKHVTGLEISEIAYVMDIPEGAVKSYLYRAKDEMRQDTAGISAEVRQLCGVETSEGLKEAVSTGLLAVRQMVHRRNVRRIRKVCISGAVAAALLVLLGSGIYFEQQRHNKDSMAAQPVSTSMVEERQNIE